MPACVASSQEELDLAALVLDDLDPRPLDAALAAMVQNTVSWCFGKGGRDEVFDPNRLNSHCLYTA